MSPILTPHHFWHPQPVFSLHLYSFDLSWALQMDVGWMISNDEEVISPSSWLLLATQIVCTSLVTSWMLLTRYEQSTRLEDLDEVITLFTYSHEALTLCPPATQIHHPAHTQIFDSPTSISYPPTPVSVPRHPFQTANNPFLPPPIFGATAPTFPSHKTCIQVIIHVFP